MMTPTVQLYDEFQEAYSIFNGRLFCGTLPECVITLQRAAGSYGYFCRQRFVSQDGQQKDEIALNPSHFAERTVIGVLSTLVHEMAHQAQFHFGKKERPGRAGYHCRAWARRMVEIGLQPSDTGSPGGKQTGYRMTHYIISGGRFDVLTAMMIRDGFQFSWTETDSKQPGNGTPVLSPLVPPRSDGSNRWKYVCPGCGLNLWGKPNAPAACWNCKLPMPRSGSVKGNADGIGQVSNHVDS
ncbi:MAG: SprT-like domain-containing protein [Planctomycetes bacterium]|nr:SprT-like domain-containing protein [Planctomycetota bacterium]